MPLRRVDHVDPVDRRAGRQARERRAVGPRDALRRHRVGMDRAVRVLEPRRGDRLGHRPRHRVADLVAQPDGRGRPVEVRGRVEVAGQQRRDAGPQRRTQPGQRGADLRQARAALQPQHLLERAAVLDRVGPVRIRREVDVAEREDLAGPDLREHVAAVRIGRVDEREARDDVQAVAPVRPAGLAGDPLGVALGLLQPDDVGAGAADDLADLAEVDDVAAEPDVERHHRHLVGRLRAGRRRQREAGDREERRQDEVPQPAHEPTLSAQARLV